MFDFRRLRNDLIALALLGATVFLALSLFSFDAADPPSDLVWPARSEPANLCGPVGAHIAWGALLAFGLGSYFVLFAVLRHDLRLFTRSDTDFALRLTGWTLMLAAICVGTQLWLSDAGGGFVVGSGGYVGVWGAMLLEQHFSRIGMLILVATAFLAGTLLAGETVLLRLPLLCITVPASLLNRFAFGPVRAADELSAEDAVPVVSRARVKPDRKEIAEPVVAAAADVDEPESEAVEEPSRKPARKPIRVNPPVTAPSEEERMREQLEAGSTRLAGEGYRLPGLELLTEAEEFPYELLAKKAQLAAATLEKTFQEFGLNVRVVEIDTGPVVTQFELELEAGLRLSKVSALADDLAIALRVPAVRVVAPIPGKNTVGVEVPNEKQVMVRLQELIASCPQATKDHRIPIFLGKDVTGRPLSVDLTRMPHLLIAGRTGTGKSVCLNTLILSMLMTRSPDQVKMLMIDPKMVELSPYRRIPHLMHPVITDMKKAEAVLAWAVDKMEERYDLLARCGVRHLDSYNKLGKEEILNRLGVDSESPDADEVPESMPYIVIVADEMADMMMTSGKDVEGHIIRLAQKSRAVGIHLVLATQKPTVDVITGLIKSNLPARIAFQVASRTDSRVVLDEMGAERLLGNGDMLYLAPGTSNLHRAQGTYVSDDDINRVIAFFSDQEPEYNVELAQITTASASNKSGGGERLKDDMYEQAIEIVIREGRGSVSLLQRCLGIGYGRAARLIDYMAEDGIVGDYNGSQAREVLYTMEQWEELRSGQFETADA